MRILNFMFLGNFMLIMYLLLLQSYDSYKTFNIHRQQILSMKEQNTLLLLPNRNMLNIYDVSEKSAVKLFHLHTIMKFMKLSANYLFWKRPKARPKRN